MMRQDWIDMKDDLVATTRQCELAGVSRATMYVRQKPLCIAMHKGLYVERPVMNISALASMLATGIAAKNTRASYS
jgi:hypothetical protein